MTIIKPCCQEGINLLPKLYKEHQPRELKFCPWCAQPITLKPRIEVTAREYNEKAPHPPNNWRVEVEFNLDSRTTAWFVMNGSDCWFDQLEANARVQLVRNFLNEMDGIHPTLPADPEPPTRSVHGIFQTPNGSFVMPTLGHEQDFVPAIKDPSFAWPKRVVLEREAAVILEQEGWLFARAAHEFGTSRFKRLTERFDEWHTRVTAFRLKAPPGSWPSPPDNS